MYFLDGYFTKILLENIYNSYTFQKQPQRAIYQKGISGIILRSLLFLANRIVSNQRLYRPRTICKLFSCYVFSVFTSRNGE